MSYLFKKLFRKCNSEILQKLPNLKERYGLLQRWTHIFFSGLLSQFLKIEKKNYGASGELFLIVVEKCKAKDKSHFLKQFEHRFTWPVVWER